ncbi:lipid kinase, YegS/Rv2252/BmrU family [Acetitomaculum ruminis DSM 5522]|uniref:Lipid kinase, YegS/Rv2252/BmrU family n=1 Tax=Acetitomaculum ruminis DSM 5522 TaxID=1120918 RepID=A0A1I0VR08_9FIRM|nr:diacylglycerol kinase family protein [Acetitomaculum ruminis]SFA78771.1 lipid kinase, YegS/Rv2252/BmrU family [Acetitomaculum ruminis DSM 5522]
MYYFIVNPNSCSKKGGKIWAEIEKKLKEDNIQYKLFMTNHRYHATEIIKSLTLEAKPKIIVVVGGDGTINEVINGIINVKSVTLGYIPAGSSNDLARYLKLPREPLEALNLILNPKYFTLLDIGRVSYGTSSRRFLVSCGIGLDAGVCHEALDSELKTRLNKFNLGSLTYAGIAIKQLIKCNPSKGIVILDDSKRLNFDNVYFTTILNSPYEGGGFKLCPKARPDDSYLDVIVVDNIIKLKMLMLFPIAHFGLHTKIKGVHIYRCKSAEIHLSKKSPVHTDGESCFLQNRISALAEEEQIRFITNTSF